MLHDPSIFFPTATPWVIPFFIAHQGCPRQCLFCNQRVITGQSAADTLRPCDVREEIVRALQRQRNHRRPVQVAFYGGSFTALPRARQAELLEAVRPFLLRGEISGIRLSTRPDSVDEQIAEFLKERGVETVELGIQSFEAEVLRRCRRGYEAGQVGTAFDHLRGAGIAVGGQLMVGLPGETVSGVLAGARRLADLRPTLVRIYPALVLEGSPLAALWRNGGYRPMTLPRAVVLCARMKEIFDRHAVPVARLGLQATPSLEREILAGPWHPAFGELVRARLYFKGLRAFLVRCRRHAAAGSGYRVHLSGADRSLLFGYGGYYYQRLRRLGLLDLVDLVYVAGMRKMEWRREDESSCQNCRAADQSGH